MNPKILISIFNRRWSSKVIILLFIFSACNKTDVLKEKPLDFLSPENAYITSDGVEQGINGIYANVRDTWYSYYENDINGLFAKGTDEAYDGEEPGGQRPWTDFSTNIVPSSSTILALWKAGYTIIQQCNLLIQRIESADDKIWASEAEKNVYLSEAMFFRAFSYRILVTLFGDIPIVKVEEINTPKTDFSRAPKADVYKAIEDDLLFAAANLPVRSEQKNPGRLTQGAAWHYLSEIYLAQGKFQLAVDASSAVINNYGYALMTNRFGTNLGKDVFGTGDVFYDLFSPNNQNLAENTEGIWVIQFEPLITGGGACYAEGEFGPRYFGIGNTPDGFKAILGEIVNGVHTGYSDTLGRGVAGSRCTNYVAYDIWQSDWNNDIRNAEHNIKRNFYFDNPASIYDKKKIDFSLYPPGSRNALKDTTNYIFPQWMKFSEPLMHTSLPARSGGGYSYKDTYAVRLPETLLIRAEAYLGLNNADLAAKDINAIRSRAKATEVSPGKVDLDYILDERARELYGEEHRMITLLRLGKLVERVRKYNNNPSTPQLRIQDRNNLFPIPQSEIDLNIGNVMTQNKGY
ncbi:MAG: RagB/SusD family nutrient uptake outer membrane protein [Chitinophagaceae bacterium]|nr:RagB/SusD family nutrient uptake outer membrane protein [Chitinophagaceae bacterium]